MIDAVHDLGPQLAANRRFCSGWAGNDPDGDLPIYRSGIGHPILNGVLRVRGVPVADAIARARRELDGVPWTWWVGADSDENTADDLLAAGATLAADLPVMAIDVTAAALDDEPDGLTILAVTSRDEIQDYVRAYAVPQGIEGDLGPIVDGEVGFAHPDVVRLAAVVGFRAVATCTILLTPDVGGLYSVSTDPSWQHRGIATALTREALRVVRDFDRRIVTLVATAPGEPIYRRIGFQEVSRYRLFTL